MISSCSQSATFVEMGTAHGIIVLEIYEEASPITATNFLRYVDEGRFEGATFYRVVTMQNQPNNDVKIEVIQGGLSFSGDHPNNLPPIRHETTEETGVLHKDGSSRGLRQVRSLFVWATNRNWTLVESVIRMGRALLLLVGW